MVGVDWGLAGRQGEFRQHPSFGTSQMPGWECTRRSTLPWQPPSTAEKPQLTPTCGHPLPQKSLTVMVFSLFCFLPGEEDPRFWGERQETSSKLFSILDISGFYAGLPEESPVLGKFRDACAPINP